MFITKRQQEALLALAATERGYMYHSRSRGCWYNFAALTGYFSARTINILSDAGWVPVVKSKSLTAYIEYGHGLICVVEP